jgi:GNAT superfamily N-acetyltransferase
VDSEIIVRPAAPTEFARVAHLVFELLSELFPEIGYKRDACIEAAETLLKDGSSVWSFLASTHDERDVGVVTLNECAAIYAGGRFGEVSELYVAPEYRSKGVGAQLIEAAAAFGRDRGWPEIEVGAPKLPAGQRTINFYLRHGFEEIGPRLDLPL